MGSQGELLIRVLLATGAVAVVPLVLPLLGPSPVHRFLSTRSGHASAWAFVVAMLIGEEVPALLLALPWTVVVVVGAVAGLDSLRRGHHRCSFVAIVATAWLAAAGVMACLALTDGGAPFTPEHLRWPTPAHFMYAGFALTTLALTARRVRAATGTWLALAGVLVGMPLLAIEIGFFASAQWTGALLVGASALTLAIEQVVIASTVLHGRPSVALLASSAALATAMILAIGFGLSTRFGFAWLSLGAMTATHGLLNSLCFTLLAALAWHIASGTRAHHGSTTAGRA
jgi:hypothetical protein